MKMIEEILKNRPACPIRNQSVKHAAVLIPLLPEDEEYSILFQIRSAEIEHQPGDICFPGGMREEGETAQENALRETMEELLVSREQIHLLGPTDYLDEPGLQVEPFAAVLREYDGSFNPSEVSEVFRVPLRFFLETEPERYSVEFIAHMPEDFPFHRIYGGRKYGWRPRKEEILFYEYEGRVIWGMTARMLYHFIETLRGEACEE